MNTLTAAVDAPVRETELDPVTFEVLKNAFATSVDLMSEQILRTCYSFVIYSRDFSAALCDARGNTVMQGSGDIAVHVGTLHFQCKAVIEEFGDDIHPGDVFAINDPYRGGTHINDVSFVRPIFSEGRIIAFAQNKGHWADIGGNVPGGFASQATEVQQEGLRMPPVRIVRGGEYQDEIVDMILANCRVPLERLGDLRSQEGGGWLCDAAVVGTTCEEEAGALRTLGQLFAAGWERVGVKAAFGAAGGQQMVAQKAELPQHQQRWLVRTLQEVGAVVVEPWLDRVLDLSAQYDVDEDGSIRYLGTTRFLADDRGRFQGVFVHDLVAGLDADSKRLLYGDGRDGRRLQRLFSRLGELIHPRLPEGFCGAFGIDAFV